MFIQVDGVVSSGNILNKACEGLGIELYVLPPKKTKWDGCVERANGSNRYEFYLFYKRVLIVEAVNKGLLHYQQTVTIIDPMIL